MRNKSLFHFALLAIAAIWLLQTCSTSYGPDSINEETMEITPIKEVRDDIANFDGQPVLISGRVESSYYFQFLGGGFYTLNDGTGRVPVFTRGFTPDQGAYLQVAVEPKPFLRLGNTIGVTATEIVILETSAEPPVLIAAQ